MSKVNPRRASPKAMGMTRQQFLAERNYRICRQIVDALYARGFITERDIVKMAMHLLRIYRPPIASLSNPKERRKNNGKHC